MQNKMGLFYGLRAENPRCKLLCAIVFIAFAILLFQKPAFATEWLARVWNPKPATDDVLIDLPCQGKMALRLVQTVVVDPNGVNAPLQDSEVNLGTSEGARAYMEYRRETHIAGALNNERGSYFLLGKYEISHAQYQAVMANSSEQCPMILQPSDALPQTSVSWYDAVEFTRRLNAWLYSDGGAHLKTIDVANGFVRLPSETEWEFATRGGLVVGDGERDNSRFFTTGSIDDYAWFNSAQSANGQPKPIGQKNPNPLGLYDLYGNAEEIVLDPFRLTRLDRLHGAVGGFTVRGGSFLDNAETLMSSRRDEYPFFSKEAKGEMRRRTTGFRVVISAPVIGDLASIRRLETAFQNLSQRGDDEEADRLNAQLSDIEQKVSEPLKSEIIKVRMGLESAFARRDDIENRSLRHALVHAGLSAREVQLSADVLDTIFTALHDPNLSDDDKDIGQARFMREYETFELAATIYTDAIVQIAADRGNRVDVQGDITKRELTEQKRQALIRYVGEAMRQISDYHAGRVTQTRMIIDNLIGPRGWYE